jgi:nicotinamidase/pyrazinamidase
MAVQDFVLWEVDPQVDFMLPGGKLYVPGAEKLLPNFRKLTASAQRGKVFLVSHGCFHVPDDPEFEQFPAHCVKGTPGSNFVPEALTDSVVRVENTADAELPASLDICKQVLLEKQTLDIFENPHADALLSMLGTRPEFIVFGVVTEYCVRLAAKGLLERGRHVRVVRDAIETLNPADGERTVAELKSLGARFTTTDEVIAALRHHE